MTNRENLPAQLTDRALAASTGKQRSLVARGIGALRIRNDDIIYQQARKTYNQLTDNGTIYWLGNEERKAQVTEIFEVFQKLAKNNYGKAFFPLSTIYSGEQSIGGDPTKAEYFKKLAFDWLHANEYLNDPEIWCDLGVLYIGENDELAVHWFQKGADAGDANSMWMLSGAYEFEKGFVLDWEAALYWQIKAAMKGHSKAQQELEYRNNHGDLNIGDDPYIDDGQVFDWYVWMTEQGIVWWAQQDLVDAHSAGKVIASDEEREAYWYKIDAAQGDYNAQFQVELSKMRSIIKRRSLSIINPKLFKAGVTISGYHIEKGARTFAAYSKAMVDDIGDAIKPYLKQLYVMVKFDPRATEIAKGMDGIALVENADIGSESINVDAVVISTLTKMMDVVFRMGFENFKANAKFVLAEMRSDYSADIADAIELHHLQAAYIGMGKGSDLIKEVSEVQSLNEIIGTTTKKP